MPEIVFTGLREGEKLHEVLATGSDTPLDQPHERLYRYLVPPLDPVELKMIDPSDPSVAEQLLALADGGNRSANQGR